MKARTRLAIAAVAIAASVGGALTAVAGTTGPNDPSSSKPLVKPLLVPVDTSTEAKFTAITPCRIVDTRVAGGRISTSSPRSFVAAGSTGFASQGGNPAGCGIPTAAVAIQANVVTTGGTGSGYLKIYPYGAAAPLASYMNYRDSSSLANGGTITLNTAGAKHFTVSTAGHRSYVVIDVSGYYVKPMWAEVTTGGALQQGSRATLAEPVTGFPGAYEVDFDRVVTGCAYTATAFDPGYNAIVEPRSSNVNGVFVYLNNSSGTQANDAFYLTVTC